MKIRMRDGTGWRDYKYLAEDVDRHANVRLYFRRPGHKKIRLLEQPGSAAFDSEYLRAFSAEPNQVSFNAVVAPSRALSGSAAPGTMRWLCQQYFASAAFQELHESTRRVRRRILDAICQRAGTFRFADMEPRNVAKLRDEKAATPEAANSYVKALRQLFAWACLPEYGYATKNPARDVGYLLSKNPDGHRAWSEEDVAKYEVRHPIGTKARLTIDLFLYTGVRISDVVRLGPQMERDGKLLFAETKGRSRIVKTHELPILPPLRVSIDATPSGHLAYLVTEAGHLYSVKGFSNWFARRCREAGLDAGLTAHGLRKLGAVRCVESGATEHQLMALFGWTTTKQAALYTRKANRARLEAGAAPLLARVPPAERNDNRIVPLSRAVNAGGTISGKKS
jgi:integrase